MDTSAPKWFKGRKPKVRLPPPSPQSPLDSHCYPSLRFPAPLLHTTPGPSQAETLLRVTSGIAAELIKAHNAGESVSLNIIRAKTSKKYGFGGVPRLVDIISAIPDEYKKALLPKLKARPIRTASGVSGVFAWKEGREGRC